MDLILCPLVIFSYFLLFFTSIASNITSYPDTYRQYVTKKVYFTIARGRKVLGNVVVGVYGKCAPDTTAGFYRLATKNIEGKSYKGARFSAFTKTTMVGGGIVCDNGSSVGVRWSWRDDEPGVHRDDIKYPNSYLVTRVSILTQSATCCKFRFSSDLLSWNTLNTPLILIGKVIGGKHVVAKMFKIPFDSSGYPIGDPVWISGCGKGSGPKKELKNFEVTDKSVSSATEVRSLKTIVMSLLLISCYSFLYYKIVPTYKIY